MAPNDWSGWLDGVLSMHSIVGLRGVISGMDALQLLAVVAVLVLGLRSPREAGVVASGVVAAALARWGVVAAKIPLDHDVSLAVVVAACGVGAYLATKSPSVRSVATKLAVCAVLVTVQPFATEPFSRFAVPVMLMITMLASPAIGLIFAVSVLVVLAARGLGVQSPMFAWVVCLAGTVALHEQFAKHAGRILRWVPSGGR